MHDAAYWRDEHPLGLIGLRHHTIGVQDLAAGAGFIDRFLGGQRRYEENRPLIGVRAIGFQIAGSIVEVQAPTEQGVLRCHLDRWNEGICSTVFAVQDLDRAQRYFTDRGIIPIAGSTVDSFALPTDASLGVLIEFMA